MWDLVQGVVDELAVETGAPMRLVDVLDGLVTIQRIPHPTWDSINVAQLRSTLAARIAIRAPQPVTILIEGATDIQPEDARIAAAVQQVLEEEINPFVASHGGRITMGEVTDGVVTVRMEGGCQGCAQASATLSRGVVDALHRAVPGLVEVRDITDHHAGETPFY